MKENVVKKLKESITEENIELVLLKQASIKIKNLIFEAEKAAGKKMLLEKRLERLEQELSPFKSAELSEKESEMIKANPKIVSEALAYYQLRYRLGHRIGNYIVFNIPRYKLVMLANRYYKFLKLVVKS